MSPRGGGGLFGGPARGAKVKVKMDDDELSADNGSFEDDLPARNSGGGLGRSPFALPGGNPFAPRARRPPAGVGGIMMGSPREGHGGSSFGATAASRLADELQYEQRSSGGFPEGATGGSLKPVLFQTAQRQQLSQQVERHHTVGTWSRTRAPPTAPAPSILGANDYGATPPGGVTPLRERERTTQMLSQTYSDARLETLYAMRQAAAESDAALNSNTTAVAIAARAGTPVDDGSSISPLRDARRVDKLEQRGGRDFVENKLQELEKNILAELEKNLQTFFRGPVLQVLALAGPNPGGGDSKPMAVGRDVVADWGAPSVQSVAMQFSSQQNAQTFGSREREDLQDRTPKKGLEQLLSHLALQDRLESQHEKNDCLMRGLTDLQSRLDDTIANFCAASPGSVPLAGASGRWPSGGGNITPYYNSPRARASRSVTPRAGVSVTETLLGRVRGDPTDPSMVMPTPTGLIVPNAGMPSYVWGSEHTCGGSQQQKELYGEVVGGGAQQMEYQYLRVVEDESRDSAAGSALYSAGAADALEAPDQMNDDALVLIPAASTSSTSAMPPPRIVKGKGKGKATKSKTQEVRGSGNGVVFRPSSTTSTAEREQDCSEGAEQRPAPNPNQAQSQ
eukprot:g1132.t1